MKRGRRKRHDRALQYVGIPAAVKTVGMTSKELIALMGCSRMYRLRSLSLKGQNEKNLCFHIALGMLAKGMAEGLEPQVLLRKIRGYLESAYKEEWFCLDWQKEKALNRDMEYMKRFLKGFSFASGRILASDYPVEISLAYECNDVLVDKVEGKASLLYQEQSGAVTGIILCRKFQRPYSYYARKEENKVMGSIELLVLLEGLMKRFPEREVKVQMIRMVSPSDTPDRMAVFEEKRGNNIIGFSAEEFLAMFPQGVAQRLGSLIQSAELACCSDCLYKEMCLKPAIMRRKKQEIDHVAVNELSFSGEQEQVIGHGKGPLRVCAGPGSGKTAVLVERVKHLIGCGVRPERILAITFTKKAAQEMEERIGMPEGPVVCTLHSLAFRILTEHEYLMGTVKLAGAVDQKCLLLKILNHAPVLEGVSYDGITMKYGLIATLLKDFDYIDRHGIDNFVRVYPKKNAAGILHVKELYDAAFREMGYITYDEQITMAVELLKSHAGIMDAVRESYDYVMVDEVQDLDSGQAELVGLIVRPPENNLMICGDADQSIYEFRGGSNRYMLEFTRIYPEARDVWLQKNYRSSEEIVGMANRLIAENKERVAVEMRSSYRTGFKPVYIPGFCSKRFPELIREICGKGYRYGDIAVIARTNKELAGLCEIMSRRAEESGMAVHFERPKYYLCEDFVFRTLLDLLELQVKGLHQDEPLYRLLTAMGCEVNKKDKRHSIYQDHLSRGIIYAFDGSEAGRYYLPVEDCLLNAYSKIYRAMQKMRLPLRQALGDMEKELFSDTVCTQEVFGKLHEMIYEKKIQSCGQLYEMMKSMRMFGDDTRVHYNDADGDRVHMLTAHDAKGKEFPVVILYGVEEFEGGNAEEDRRTLYVAVTRARKVLFLLEGYPGKSNFLREMSGFITVNRRERYEN